MRVKSATWMRVTPAGIERAPRPFRERVADLAADLERVAIIARADLKATYFGRAFGWLWLILEPLLLAGVYWIVTAVLWEVRPEDTSRFLAILLSVVFWIWFARTLNAAPFVLTANATLLRDTGVPAPLLLAVTLVKELVNFALAFAVTLVFLLALGMRPGWALVSFPVVWLAQLVTMVCLTMVLAVAGTFVKDLATILANLLPLVWFLSPGIYPAELVERRLPALAPFLMLNPLYYLLPSYEAIFIFDRIPPLRPLLIMIAAGVPALILAFALFRRARYRYYSHL